MPVQGAESYSDYMLGNARRHPQDARNGPKRSPPSPPQTIARIAREYATLKPAVLYQGYGMQRRAYGEQVVRAGCVLAAITGNVGMPGGWASGLGLQAPDGGRLLDGLPDRREPGQGPDPGLSVERGLPARQEHDQRPMACAARNGWTTTSS